MAAQDGGEEGDQGVERLFSTEKRASGRERESGLLSTLYATVCHHTIFFQQQEY
jgi:hypothetical protein